jgi:hypothetical protein
MDDQLDVPLEDSELLAEVELTTNLIIAATESDAKMSQREIDRLLGLVVSGAAEVRSFPTQHVRKV